MDPDSIYERTGLPIYEDELDLEPYENSLINETCSRERVIEIINTVVQEFKLPFQLHNFQVESIYHLGKFI